MDEAPEPFEKAFAIGVGDGYHFQPNQSEKFTGAPRAYYDNGYKEGRNKRRTEHMEAQRLLSLPLKLQAKDIPDFVMLDMVFRLQNAPQVMTLKARNEAGHRIQWTNSGWVMRWQLEAVWERIPPKVILAKAKKLMRRKLLDGCACGCRGDFHLTDAGIQYIQEFIRDNRQA